MTHQDFLRADENRRRYWARSFVGWKRFAERTRPNPAHDALAALQREGHVWRLITQNVDGLHHAARVEDVLELHGTTHEVICLACGVVSREDACRKSSSVSIQTSSTPPKPSPALPSASPPTKPTKPTTPTTPFGSARRARDPAGDAEIDARRAATFRCLPARRAAADRSNLGLSFSEMACPRPSWRKRRRRPRGRRGVGRRLVGVHVQRVSTRSRRRGEGRAGGGAHRGRDARGSPRDAQGGTVGGGDAPAGVGGGAKGADVGVLVFKTRAHLERRERERRLRPDDPSTRRPGRRCRSFVTYITSNRPARGAASVALASTGFGN